MVRDLLLGFVKEEWVQDLDFQTLEKVGDSYVSDDIRDRHDDIVWRVRWGKDWLYVYLILEFQSTIDIYMPLRLMTYVGLLYQDLIRTKQLTISGKLPPVLPVVTPIRNEPIDILSPEFPEKIYRKGVCLTKKQMVPIEKRTQRVKGLEKWFFSISPELNSG